MSSWHIKQAKFLPRTGMFWAWHNITFWHLIHTNTALLRILWTTGNVFPHLLFGQLSPKMSRGWHVFFWYIKTVKFLPRTSLAMAGKLFAAGNFSVVYMYTAEIYPTTIRFVYMFTAEIYPTTVRFVIRDISISMYIIKPLSGLSLCHNTFYLS